MAIFNRFYRRSCTQLFAHPSLGRLLRSIAFSLIVIGVGSTHAEEPRKLTNSEPLTAGFVSPEQALKMLELPDGFSATLFAAEPNIQNPIAAHVDQLNRVWVAENYTYAERSQRFDLSFNDRVVVLEDADGDGIAEKQTVFSDDLKMLTGLAVGHGGLWLTCPPQLIFIPDADNDLVPDGPPQIILDGFHVARENYHNFANGLSWGPDGWLYGRCGASCPGMMGIPGCDASTRVPIRGGIWRYHPKRRVVEALNQGTTNPWGHDWNAAGELFYINTVNGHLWHVIPGAHFVRSHTIDANPYAYLPIDTHADHWHFDTGQSWTKSRDGAANEYGGGHAHIGMMICHSSTWPDELQGRLLTVNMHGRRINVDRLEPHGSGYIGRHQADLFASADVWFRGMDIIPMADGNAILLDWSDTGECHEHTGVHRTSGRIFKLSYKSHTKPLEPNSNTLSHEASGDNSLQTLARMSVMGEEWLARKAHQQVFETHIKDKRSISEATGFGISILKNAAQPKTKRLRALWLLNALQNNNSIATVSWNKLLIGLLSDPTPELRTWAIRLLTERCPIDLATGQRPPNAGSLPTASYRALVKSSREETELSVLLTYASTLQRLPHEMRSELALNLIDDAQLESDHNLPLMIWYGISPLGDSRLSELAELGKNCQIPTTLQLIARRCADQLEDSPEAMEHLLSNFESLNLRRAEALAQGISDGLMGRRKATKPQNWQTFESKCRQLAQRNGAAKNITDALAKLSVLFGDGLTIENLINVARDRRRDLDERKSALQSLVQARAPGIKKLCSDLLDVRYLNTVAVEGLAATNDAATGDLMLKKFRRFAATDRPRVLSILCTRPTWAAPLLAAIEAGAISKDELSAFQARQIASLGVNELNLKLSKVWGQVRESPEEIRKQIKELKVLLSSQGSAPANLQKGQLVFAKACAACHTLFGLGGKIGPDLTGAQRANLDYLLENIIDPGAVVSKEFRATVLVLDDDRVLSGLVTSQDKRSLKLATQEKTFTIPREEIASMRLTEASTMPAGLLDSLNSSEIIDLFQYLQSSGGANSTSQ